MLSTHNSITHSVINTRLGYERRGVEVFVNVLNLTDELYISSASRGNNATDRTNFPIGPAHRRVEGPIHVCGKSPVS